MSPWMPVYRALTAALAPLARRRLAQQGQAFEEVAGREPERRGQVPDAAGELWLHAASVGELNAAGPLIERLLDDPDRRIVISTLTPSAAALARSRYAERPRTRTLLAPLDRPADVTCWLERTRPKRLLLVETELWPEMLRGCLERSVPIAIANARLSVRAAGRYRRLRGLFAPLLERIGPVACQTEDDAVRFQTLGVRERQLRVTGNIKFDPAPAEPLPDGVKAAVEGLGDGPRWVAGSTHRGEEALIAEAHVRLLEHDDRRRLVLVPRHPERADEALDTLRSAGLTAERLSRSPDPAGLQALVIDRIGVLAGLYPLADVNFVGGSLVEGIGGHNLIEAVDAGRPVLTGPHTGDQVEAATGLEQAGGLRRVENAAGLADAVDHAMRGDPAVDRMKANAERFLSGQRGALDRTLEVLKPWLDGRG